MFILKRITKHPVWHAEYENRYTLGMSFVRMQEYYESPKFRGKIFDLEQYMDWYASERGHFTYTSDWSGYNIPGFVVKEFKEKFSDFSRKENLLLKALEKDGFFDYKSYLIGSTSKEGRDVLGHELHHAVFYCVEEYRNAVTNVINEFGDSLDALRKFILSLGYCEEVLIDEINAFVTDGDNRLREFTPAGLKDRLLDIDRQFDVLQ